jgi:hypothetical protein
MISLVDKVRPLLLDAAAVYRDRPRAAGLLHEHVKRFDGPLRIAIAGQAATGKSTLAAALDAGTSRHAPARETSYLDMPALAGLGEREDDPVVHRMSAEAHAVVYLVRHLEAEQLAALSATASSPMARSTGVNSLLALSRADEVGAGRIDALQSAKQIARRARLDDAYAQFQGVVAVAGQLAYAGTTLQDNEFTALARLASVSRVELDGFLLSVDEFLTEPFPVPVTQPERRALLARFGVFGVRLATTLVRTGCDNGSKLAGQLVQRSGLTELRAAIDTHLVARGEVLKCRSGLLALETVLLAEPHPHRERLSARLEQVIAGAHDFSELRAISSIHCGRASLADEVAGEAFRLLGLYGTGVCDRLGIPEETDEGEAFSLAAATLERWRRAAGAPDSGSAERAVARIVVRSCEGMLAQFD